jgi:hypothetical protein
MQAGNHRRRAATTGCIKKGRSGHRAPPTETTEAQTEAAAVGLGAMSAVRGLPLGHRAKAPGGTTGFRGRCSVAWQEYSRRPKARLLPSGESSSGSRVERASMTYHGVNQLP